MNFLFKKLTPPLILCLTLLLAYSCSKEELIEQDFSDELIIIRTNSTTGVVNNGRWLIFESQKNYNKIYDSLSERINSYDF